MRLLVSSLRSLALLFVCAACASSDARFECAGKYGESTSECQQPMRPVTTVAPGANYVAKLSCPGCALRVPFAKTEGDKYHTIFWENDLFFNISLTHDNRTLLLNDQAIFPSLSTSPRPPSIVAPHIRTDFTRRNLGDAIECAKYALNPGNSWISCIQPTISEVLLDFDYSTRLLESPPETQGEKWEVILDAIGGRSGSPGDNGQIFDSEEQSALRIIVQGRKIHDEHSDGHGRTASPMFGTIGESDSVYEYGIASVEFTERHLPLPRVAQLDFWGKIRRYFGNDVLTHGHVVYLAEEWGNYGKKGSFRDGFGIFIHDWPWDVVFMVVGIVLFGLACLSSAYWLFYVVKRQRELARWDGMDQVWARMRRERDEDEQLLDGGYRDVADGERQSRDEGYRDDPNERPPAYSDEIQTNKPLPSKPLPDKPLPPVPLIDAL